MDANLERLRIVAQIARLGSVTLAARSLHLTPSAVSQQLRAFETAVGHRLFDRHPRGMSLTAAGRLVAARAAAVAAEISGLERDLQLFEAGGVGRVSLGVFPTFAASLLPLVIQRFRQQEPDVHLEVRSAKLTELQARLGSGELDVSVLWSFEDVAPGASDDSIAADPTVLLVPRDHPTSSRSTVTIVELAAERWITRADGHPGTDLLHRVGAEAGFVPQVALAASDYQETQALVAAGLGVALVPRLATTALRDDVAVVSIGGGMPRRRLRVECRDASGHAAAAKLASLIESVLRSPRSPLEGDASPTSPAARAQTGRAAHVDRDI